MSDFITGLLAKDYKNLAHPTMAPHLFGNDAVRTAQRAKHPVKQLNFPDGL